MLKNLIMAGASKNANDNLFDYVRALGHFEGIEGAFYLTDPKGITYNFSNGATVSRVSPLVGVSSARTTSTGRIILGGTENIDFGTADFSVELTCQFDNVSGGRILLRKRSTTANQTPIMIYQSNLNLYGRFTNTSGTSFLVLLHNNIAIGDKYRICIERVGDAFYGYMNGTRVDGIPITGAAYVNTQPITLMCDVSGSSLVSGFLGRLDEFRLTVGKNRYNGANSYTLVEPFPNS